MRPIQITFFAHATTFDNEAGIATGQADTNLSPLGEIQVRNLRQAAVEKKFDAVFCSDLIRANRTAEGAFGDRLTVQIDSRLREIDIGSLTRRADSEVGPLMKEHLSKPFPNGESLDEVAERVKEFLTEIRQRYEGGHVAIIGHQVVQLALEVLLNKLTWEEALERDWRKTKAFQFGWDYVLI